VRDSTSWSEPRTSDKISEFLKQQCTALKTTPVDPPGAPHTLIVTLSGIRAADVCRSLKSGLTKQGIKDQKIEKLFAKHLKLKDQVEQLKKNKLVPTLCHDG
jgi:protein CMS1